MYSMSPFCLLLTAGSGFSSQQFSRSSLPLQTLHLFNGTIKFSQGYRPITAGEHLSTIRVTDMKLVVLPALEPDLAAMDGDKYMSVLEVSGYKTSLLLENCTVGTTFDTPALDRLTACTAQEGAHVCVQYQHLVVACGLSCA
jgi:hypothetical protein